MRGSVGNSRGLADSLDFVVSKTNIGQGVTIMEFRSPLEQAAAHVENTPTPASCFRRRRENCPILFLARLVAISPRGLNQRQTFFRKSRARAGSPGLVAYADVKECVAEDLVAQSPPAADFAAGSRARQHRLQGDV